MSTNTLETFLSFSELVSNNNIITNYDELKNKLLSNGTKFIYIGENTQEIKTQDRTAGEEGIESALVEADYGIAETGSIVIDSSDEKLRLATCLAEKLYVILPKSKIVDSLEDVEEYMREKTSGNSSYIAFITGASRTADIERVLTIGVHGPCEMTIYIVEDR